MKQRITKTVLSILTALCLLVSSLGLAQAQTLTGNAIVKQGVTVSNNTYTFDPVGGTATYTTPSKAWEIKSVSTNATWITAMKKSSRSVTITVPKNENASGRSGKVTVVCNKGTQTLTVKQTGNTLTLSDTTIDASSFAGSKPFTATPIVGKVTVSTSTDWLTVTKTSGNNYEVTFPDNLTEKDRTALISLSVGSIKKTIKVTQKKPTTQEQKDHDLWPSTRETKLKAFYDNLIKGANNRGDKVASNALSKAKTLSTFSWTCLKDIKCYLHNGSFTAGHKYVGAPYQQYNTYLGFDATPQDLINNAKNINSSFYNPESKTGPGYGTDCSGFAAYCIGFGHIDSGTFYEKYKDEEKHVLISENNKADVLKKISSGDVIWRSKHVYLVASVLRDGNTVKAIVILESRNMTTASARNIHVYYDDDASLRKIFGNISLSDCKTILDYVVGNTGTIDRFINSFDKTGDDDTPNRILLDVNK